MTPREWRLDQARQALADNIARAKLPPAARAAAIGAELALGEIVRTQRRWQERRNAAIAWRFLGRPWRDLERDIEDGSAGL